MAVSSLDQSIRPTRITYDSRGRMCYNIPLLCGQTQIAPRARHGIDRPHGMDAWELHLSLDGACHFLDDSDARSCPRACCALFPPGTPLRFQADRRQGWHQLYIYFQARPGWRELLTWSGATTPPMLLSIADEQRWLRIRDCAHELLRVSREPLRRRLDLSWNMLERLLLLIDLDNPATDSRALDPRIAALIELLHASYAEAIDVHEMATRCDLSPTRFSAIFKRDTGRSPRQFLEDIRIERACERLLAGDEAVDAVAAAVGFDNPFYFSRVFRRCIGQAPSHWRRDIRGE